MKHCKTCIVYSTGWYWYKAKVSALIVSIRLLWHKQLLVSKTLILYWRGCAIKLVTWYQFFV